MEFKDEDRLMLQSFKNLYDHLLNMSIDVKPIDDWGNELEKNMSIIAREIIRHNQLGFNVRYKLLNDTPDDKAEWILKNKIIEFGISAGLDTEGILSNINILYPSGTSVIDIILGGREYLRSLDERNIGENQFFVGLKDNLTKNGVSIPNYLAASSIALSMASLKIAKKSLDQAAYNKYRDNIFEIIKSIYRRYKVEIQDDDFNIDDLEFIVSGCGHNKLWYAIFYALPPIIKDSIDKVLKYHQTLYNLQQFA